MIEHKPKQSIAYQKDGREAIIEAVLAGIREEMAAAREGQLASA